MTRVFLLTFALAIAMVSSNAIGQESKVTTWKGTLVPNGTKLRLEIDVVERAGKLTGELRSLDQGNAKLPATERGKLSNGLQLVVARRDGVPVVNFEVVF